MKTTKDQDNIILQAGKKKMFKLATYMPKLYNKLCPKCRLVVVRLAKRGKSNLIMQVITTNCPACAELMAQAEKDLK